MKESQSTELPNETSSFWIKPPRRFWPLFWTFPIWWVFTYMLLLYCINKLTTYFGTPLYILVPESWLFMLWAVVGAAGLFLAIVFSFSRVSITRQKGICALINWFLISLIFDVTQGAITHDFGRAAGRPEARSLIDTPLGQTRTVK
jgi:hypothetical protein